MGWTLALASDEIHGLLGANGADIDMHGTSHAATTCTPINAPGE